MAEKQRYPLSWPEGWKRTTARVDARFGKHRKAWSAELGRATYDGKARLSIEDAFDRVEAELSALNVDESTVVVSTNLRVNMRGMPTGNRSEPGDPGVAVYWTRKGKGQCMAIDAYYRVADNLAAVAATLEAMRAIERHGGAQILERAFIGFAQLPESSGVDWREVLGFERGSNPSEGMIRDHFRSRAAEAHPDKSGGNNDRMVRLNVAMREALAELAAIALTR